MTERFRNANIEGPKLEYLDRSVGTDTNDSVLPL